MLRMHALTCLLLLLLPNLQQLSKSKHAWYFEHAVNVEEVPDYLEIIKRPMHLQRVWDKVTIFKL
jgi:Bromodomain